MRSAALGHLRVLDLSRVVAGPWTSQVLADLGAEVPKVVRSPIRRERTPVHHGPVPRLGEHTREVLVEVLGTGEAEVEELRRKGVI